MGETPERRGRIGKVNSKPSARPTHFLKFLSPREGQRLVQEPCVCLASPPPPFSRGVRFSPEPAPPARRRKAGADGRLLSLSPRAATVPAASPASAAPPPSYDLPVSAAAARAQRSRRGQNCNLLSNGRSRSSALLPCRRHTHCHQRRKEEYTLLQLPVSS